MWQGNILTSGGLEVAGCVVALGKENVVACATLEGLIKWDRRAHELLLDLAETVETRLDLEMVVRISLSNGADDGDVVTLRANIVCP